jgi:hypothetical protein
MIKLSNAYNLFESFKNSSDSSPLPFFIFPTKSKVKKKMKSIIIIKIIEERGSRPIWPSSDPNEPNSPT